jgi:hypothetical protein
MVGGGAGWFAVETLPTEIGVWIAMKVAAPAHETGPEHPHRFKAHVLSPSMDPIPDTDVELDEVTMASPPAPLSEAQEIVPTYHRFLAETEGMYTLDMSVDDRHTTVPILVTIVQEDTSPDDAEAQA